MNSLKLYPHNEEAYASIQQAFSTSNRAAVIQPTGTGKSYLISKLMLDYREDNVLVLSPSVHINRQIRKVLGKNTTHTRFMTYSYLSKMEPEKRKKLRPKLIVLDEFHRVGAKTWGSAVDELLKKNPASKILGTSATPIRYLDSERDMSDELFDGNVAVHMTLSESIVRGIVPTPTYISALYTLDDEFDRLKRKINRSTGKEEKKNQLIKELEKLKHRLEKSRGVPQILQKYIPSGLSPVKFIVFCKDKEHMELMTKEVPKWFKKSFPDKKIVPRKLYSLYSDNEKTLQQFEEDNGGTVSLLFTIDMLNEGVHVKGVSGVVLLRPTISPIIFYQQIGRAITAGNQKSPLIFDFVNNADAVGARTFKENLMEAVQAYQEKCHEEDDSTDIPSFAIYDEITPITEKLSLIEAEIDDYWTYCFELFLEYVKEHGTTHVPKRFIYNDYGLGEWCQKQRQYRKYHQLPQERIEKLNQSGFIWDADEYLWEEQFQAFARFKKEHGHGYVDTNHEDDTLYNWCRRQRKLHQQCQLEKDRVSKLTTMGFIWDVPAYQWKVRYEALKEFLSKHSLEELKEGVEYKGVSLLAFYKTNQLNFKNGNLAQWQMDLLEEIEFYPNFLDKSWQETYDVLLDWLKVSCIRDIHSNVVHQDVYIGRWVWLQMKNLRNGTLKKEYYEKLDALGLDWNPKESRQETLFRLLEEYHQEHGHILVPLREKYKGEHLGHWLKRVRKYKKENRLEEGWEDRLNSLGMVWNPIEHEWEKQYQALVEYKRLHGHVDVGQKDTYEGLKIGEWAIKQRIREQSGYMSASEKDKLDAIGFIWNPIEYRWNSGFESLKSYMEESGLEKVELKKRFSNHEVGKWVSLQRRRFKRGDMTPKQEEKLRSIGFCF